MLGTRTSLDVALAPWRLSSLASRYEISGSVWHFVTKQSRSLPDLDAVVGTPSGPWWSWGETNGVPECLVAYPPNEILKILRRKPESCYMSCDDGTPTHSSVTLRWTAKLEGSTQG